MSYTPKQQGNSSNSSGSSNAGGSGSGQSNQNVKNLVGIAGIQQQMQNLVHGQNQQTPQATGANFNSLINIQRQQQFESIIKQQQQLLLSNPQFVQQMQQNVASGAGKDLLSLTRTPGATELLSKTIQSQIQQQANGNTVGSGNVTNVPAAAAVQLQQQFQAFAQNPANIMQQLQAYQFQMQQQQQQQQQSQSQQQQQQQNRIQQQSYQQTQNAMGNQFAQQFQTNYQQQKFLAAAAAVQQQAAAVVASKTQATLGNQMKAPNLPSQTQITPIPPLATVSTTTSQTNNYPNKTASNKPISSGLSGNSNASKNQHNISPITGPTTGIYSKSSIISARPLSTIGAKGLNQIAIPGIKSSSKLPPPTQITAVPLTKPTVATSSPVKTTQSALLKTTTTTSSANVSSVSASKGTPLINSTKSEIPASTITTNSASNTSQTSTVSTVNKSSSDTIIRTSPPKTVSTVTENSTDIIMNSNLATSAPITLTSPPPIITTTATKSVTPDITSSAKKVVENNKDKIIVNKIDVSKNEVKGKDNESKTEINKDLKKQNSPKKSDVKSDDCGSNILKEDKLKSDENFNTKISVNVDSKESKQNVKITTDELSEKVNDINKSSEITTCSNEIKQLKKTNTDIKIEHPKQPLENKISSVTSLTTTTTTTIIEKPIVKNQRNVLKKKNETKSDKTEKDESKTKEEQSSSIVSSSKEKNPVKISKTVAKNTPGTSANSTPVSTDDGRRSKRHRLKTILYQSPLPELAFITKLSASEASNSPKPSSSNEDKLVLFYKNEYLAVRNADNGFFLCQTIQNVYKTSPKIRIRWLSEEKKDSCIYIPDFYDNTDIECFLTTVNLRKEKKERLKLPETEKERIESILKKAIDVENGTLPKPDITEENPDGLDISLYKNESQIEKKLSSVNKKRSASTSPKRNTKKTLKQNKTLIKYRVYGENKDKINDDENDDNKDIDDNDNEDDDDDDDDDEPTDTTTEEEGDVDEYRPHTKTPALQVVRSQRSVLAKARAASPIINETPKKVPNKNDDKIEELTPVNNKNRGKRRLTTDAGDDSPISAPSKKYIKNPKKQVLKTTVNSAKTKKDEEVESPTSSTSGRTTRNRK